MTYQLHFDTSSSSKFKKFCIEKYREMNQGGRGITTPEAFINFSDAPEVQALNFPPTEIDRKPTDKYIERDESKINTFFYPSNVTHRNYQYDISEMCFRYNTLVCLPTASGKTLIAAVVMMNFFRWYPKGKIIFMAPTRTLVNQQIEACSNFTNISKDKVIIMTGTNIYGKAREQMWKEKTVFFCTPQVVQNDLHNGRLDASKIVLLIVDEAHHASGKYAYSVVVRSIAARNSQFRVVGLSATPGSDMRAIQGVIFNLMISKVVYLDDNDPEIAKYQQKTDVEIIVVPLGADESTLEELLGQCIRQIAQPLQLKGHLRTSDPKLLNRGVFYEMKNFQQSPIKSKEFYNCMNLFSILLSLVNMKEKITKYGAQMLNQALKDFEKKGKQTLEKKKLIDSSPFQTLLRLAEKSKNTSHPKLAQLGVILEDFLNKNVHSKVIVFTQYRASAVSIEEHLKKIPVVKCSIFIGHNDTRQNEGLDESTQIEIISLFRKGNINCIIATSVGEEGLDIGEVDLIVCYDTSSSPLKTVQRMGRTGRKKNGKVIFLMAEGYEEKSLEKAQSTRNYLKTQLNKAVDKFTLYNPDPPNLPLPDVLTAVKIPCAKVGKYAELDNDNKNSSGKKENISKAPTLHRHQAFALSKCFGPKMKFTKIKLPDRLTKSNGIYFSHSAESEILANMRSRPSIPEDIEAKVLEILQREQGRNTSSSSSDDEILSSLSLKTNKNTKNNKNVSKISKNDKNKGKTGNEKKKSANPWEIESESDIENDSDDKNSSDDMSIPCIPLSMHLSMQDGYSSDEESDMNNFNKKNKKVTSFLPDDSEDDIDADDVEENLDLDIQPTKTDRIFLNFDDDDDIDDEEIIRLSEESDKKFSQISSATDTYGSEIENVAIKKELATKSQRKFLDDDSDLDIDF
ncbi:Type III restriction enzyme, res subunit family protein [Tritrichomonas foetus]|uniref:Type III restriction enzyme, res subunit family protein n=1 Tax=Tritrichomonas foetus TaxID=1144522 RepID=A0A1J4K412_9EUKA|nr:Type III restriction enzyme, res subunit family protein [Tritrichomonas foetus]|eukprot:OHT06127.1 Type III restriction enzyme, res subunit family protein [Tritrichomonas foetus]